jgi:hypothetical protein
VDTLSVEDIPRLLPDPEFVEAAKVLNMIAQTPEQLILYNARLKAQRDESGRLLQARLEGEQAAQAAFAELQAAFAETQAATAEAQAAAAEAQAATAEAQAATAEAQAAAAEAQTAAAQAQARGILIGQISLLQKLLKKPISTAHDLATCDDATLSRMADELQDLLTSGTR